MMVPKIDKQHTAMITLIVDPTAQTNNTANITIP
jgi:hypothetical protein